MTGRNPPASGDTTLIQSMLIRLGAAALLGSQIAGCATLTGDGTQASQVETLDEQGHVVEGMRCKFSNASSDYFADTPVYGLEVHRSASDLQISCRLGDRVAEGKAVSRGGIKSIAAMLLPGGSAYMVIDHLSGYRYTYPAWVRLQVGQKLVFDASDDKGGAPVAGLRPDGTPPVASAPKKAQAIVRSD
jgi:hypothetical protein